MGPVVLLLKGCPGSGKSTLALALARRLRWPIVSKDAARDPLQAVCHRAVAGEVSWNELSYDIMFSFLSAQLEAGLDVIVDSPLARRQLFDAAQEVAQKYNAELALVECVAVDQAVWRQRLEQRGLQDAGTQREHKPGSWAAAQLVLRRNADGETWPQDVLLPFRFELDTTQGSADAQADAVCQALTAAGLLSRCP